MCLPVAVFTMGGATGIYADDPENGTYIRRKDRVWDELLHNTCDVVPAHRYLKRYGTQVIVVDYTSFCIRTDHELNVISVTPPGSFGGLEMWRFSTIAPVGEDLVFSYENPKESFKSNLMFLKRGKQTPERLFDKPFVGQEKIRGLATFKHSDIRDLLPTPKGLLILTDNTLLLVPELKSEEAAGKSVNSYEVNAEQR